MQSDSIGKLAEAIAKAQSELKPVKKGCSNPFYHSKYADLASVWEALKPFHVNGIAITQEPYIPEREGYIGIETKLSHSSGEWMCGRLELPMGKQDAQGAGSAITYARRYALGCMTGVVTEEDDDGNAASTAQPGRPVTPAQVKKVADSKLTAAKKIAELRIEGAKKDAPVIDDVRWQEFLDYVADDPDRYDVGDQLKQVLAIGMVSQLTGAARFSFIQEFQKSCKETGVACEEWVK